MIFYIDAEFIEDGTTIEPISLAVVREDGMWYYAELDDVPWERADPWVVENVKPHLGQELPDVLNAWRWRSGAVKTEVAADLFEFTRIGNVKPVFWGYYCDYDWVLFCRFFGRMIDLPRHWPMFCLDVKQLAVHLGNPRLPEQDGVEHHALFDAKWTKEAHEYLRRIRQGEW